MDYRKAGVDIDAAQAALGAVKDKIRATFGKEVLHDVGHFGGLFLFAMWTPHHAPPRGNVPDPKFKPV